MPTEHLGAAKLWYRKGLRLVFDELDAQHFTPDPVHLDLNKIGKWLRAWPELADVLNPLLAFVAENREEYLADAPLYETLAPVLPDMSMPMPLHLPERDTDEPFDLDAWADALPDGHAGDFLVTLYQERERHRHGERFVSRVAIREGEVVYHPPPRLPPEMFAHPAVLLNATADVNALRHLLECEGYPVEVYSPNVGLCPQTSVDYVLDANHSKSAVSGKGDGYRKRWVQRVRDAVAGSEQALVVATKDGEGFLRQPLADLLGTGQVALAHYGAVSGLNAYQESDCVVLAQPFNPSPSAVAGLYRRVYGGVSGEPLDLTTCYRTVTLPWSDSDGTTWEVAVSSMRDERLAPIYEHWRWSEMYQAAHRVRPILNKRRIVVVCAIPLAGLEPTTASYSNGKWQTRNKLGTAAGRLIREQGFFTRQGLAEAAGVHKTTVGRHWSDLVRALGLRVVERAVPSARYPGGRVTETAMA
jgi:uncharacterized RmlC-like cupin family protein